MKMKEYASLILESVGGAHNINKAAHCFTRLRLDLKDNTKIDVERVNKIECVKGSKINDGQFQIIIGNEVEELYQELLTCLHPTTINEKNETADSVTLFGKFITMISAIFIPIFPALVAGGLMKGILVAIQFSKVMDTSGSTFAVLNMFADAPFYFLPIILAYSAAKRFACNPYIAVVIAGIMLHPSYATLGDKADFFEIGLTYVNYASTVFPILIGVYLMSWIEKGMKKISPKSLSMLLVPLFTILLTAPVILLFIGPIVNEGSLLVGNGVIWLFDTFGGFAGGIVGFVYPFLVFTGLHQAIPPIELQNLAQSGVDPILASIACANAAIAGTTLMVSMKSRNKATKSLAISSSLSAIIGITEPALYGVVSHRKETFLATFIGGALGGAFVSFFQVQALGMGPVPLAGMAVFFGDTFIYYIIGILLSIVVSMLAVQVLGFKEDVDEKNKSSEQATFTMYAPMRGNIVDLKEVNDATFSNEIMGRGIAIYPASGEVYAPADGEVSALFSTGHAVGLTCGDKEIILHVGIDTVKLEGKYFTTHVQKGDHVRKGDLLLTFEKEAIEEEGYDLITPIVFTNLNKTEVIQKIQQTFTKEGDSLLTIKEVH